MYETNNRTKCMLKKQIDEVLDKGNISPSEMDCIYKAYKTLGQIATIEAMDWYEDEYGTGYSGKRMHGGIKNHSMANMPIHDYDESYRRGRGANGRYVSRSDGRDSYNDGYSEHSVEDRTIAFLEDQMRYANSDYERQKIEEQIRGIRQKQK